MSIDVEEIKTGKKYKQIIFQKNYLKCETTKNSIKKNEKRKTGEKMYRKSQ